MSCNAAGTDSSAVKLLFASEHRIVVLCHIAADMLVRRVKLAGVISEFVNGDNTAYRSVRRGHSG
jgi:hypothetical protein